MQDFSSPITAPRQRSFSMTVFVALLAFLLGAIVVAWAVSRGYLADVLVAPAAQDTQSAALVAEDMQPTESAAVASAPSQAEQMAKIGTVEGRLAMLEDRISRVDFETGAASGNAARAEGLLIAFAARRMVDRGEPLSYVADQLRLRFQDAQPRAVETVIAFSRNPVTIDELTARLEALSPELTVNGADQSLWDRARHELSGLFVVRRDSSALVTPQARVERARVMLTARRIDNAVREVERLPGADAAGTWIADARRYQDVQRALDLLETTAMLEPNRLHDSAGQNVNEPSPLATPAAGGALTPATPTPQN